MSGLRDLARTRLVFEGEVSPSLNARSDAVGAGCAQHFRALMSGSNPELALATKLACPSLRLFSCCGSHGQAQRKQEKRSRSCKGRREGPPEMECQSRATLHQVPHPALEANCSCLHLIACRSAGYRHAKLVSMAGAEQGGFPLHVAPFQYGLQVKANKTMLEWSGNGAQLLPSRCSNALLCPTQTWIPSSKGKSFSPGRIRYAIGPRSVPGAPTMAILRRSASWCNALPQHLAAQAFFFVPRFPNILETRAPGTMQTYSGPGAWLSGAMLYSRRQPVPTRTTYGWQTPAPYSICACSNPE